MATTTYKKDVKPRLEDITKWRKEGYNLDMIAKALGIARKTLYEYTKKHEELREAIAKGKKMYEFELKESLYARAKGFKVVETTKREYFNADGHLIKYVVTTSDRYIYSDFMAAKLLKLETVLDSEEIPHELKELMKIEEDFIEAQEGEYANH